MTAPPATPEIAGDWRSRALCRPGSGIDPDLFFPHESDAVGQAAAEAICGTCPVQAECGNYARQHRVTHGVWAGTRRDRITPTNHKRLPCGTEAAFKRHQRAGEDPCTPCREANALKRAQRSAAAQ